MGNSVSSSEPLGGVSDGILCCTCKNVMLSPIRRCRSTSGEGGGSFGSEGNGDNTGDGTGKGNGRSSVNEKSRAQGNDEAGIGDTVTVRRTHSSHPTRARKALLQSELSSSAPLQEGREGVLDGMHGSDKQIGYPAGEGLFSSTSSSSSSSSSLSLYEQQQQRHQHQQNQQQRRLRRNRVQRRPLSCGAGDSFPFPSLPLLRDTSGTRSISDLGGHPSPDGSENDDDRCSVVVASAFAAAVGSETCAKMRAMPSVMSTTETPLMSIPKQGRANSTSGKVVIPARQTMTTTVTKMRTAAVAAAGVPELDKLQPQDGPYLGSPARKGGSEVLASPTSFITCSGAHLRGRRIRGHPAFNKENDVNRKGEEAEKEEEDDRYATPEPSSPTSETAAQKVLTPKRVRTQQRRLSSTISSTSSVTSTASSERSNFQKGVLVTRGLSNFSIETSSVASSVATTYRRRKKNKRLYTSNGCSSVSVSGRDHHRKQSSKSGAGPSEEELIWNAQEQRLYESTLPSTMRGEPLRLRVVETYPFDIPQPRDDHDYDYGGGGGSGDAATVSSGDMHSVVNVPDYNDLLYSFDPLFNYSEYKIESVDGTPYGNDLCIKQCHPQTTTTAAHHGMEGAGWDGAGGAGCGTAHDGGDPFMTLQDRNGKVYAAIKSRQTYEPSFVVYGSKPRYEGQNPSSHCCYGSGSRGRLYAWALVKKNGRGAEDDVNIFMIKHQNGVGLGGSGSSSGNACSTNSNSSRNGSNGSFFQTHPTYRSLRIFSDSDPNEVGHRRHTHTFIVRPRSPMSFPNESNPDGDEDEYGDKCCLILRDPFDYDAHNVTIAPGMDPLLVLCYIAIHAKMDLEPKLLQPSGSNLHLMTPPAL